MSFEVSIRGHSKEFLSEEEAFEEMKGVDNVLRICKVLMALAVLSVDFEVFSFSCLSSF